MRSRVARSLATAAGLTAFAAVAAGCAAEYYPQPIYAPQPAHVYVAPPRAYGPQPPRPYCRRAWIPSGYDHYGRYHPGYWRCI